MSTGDEIQGAAMALVDKLSLLGDMEDWQTADSFVALTTNAETNDVHLNGPFAEAEAAWAWAEAHEIELNKGMPSTDDPFTVTVYPMHEPA